jgi:AcrR family transcriptional regulator
MSKATFYEHFANKEECVLALFDEAATELMRSIGDDDAHVAIERYDHLVRHNVRAFLTTLETHPNSTRTLLVEVAGASPRLAARRDAVLEAFSDRLVRSNARNAERYGVPCFASRDDAFAVVGGIVELVARRLRGRDAPSLRDLEPVIVRLVLGTLDRASTG